MPLKDILVHIDDNNPSVTRLELAVNLAMVHQAHVTGLYVIPPPPNSSLPGEHSVNPWVLMAQPGGKKVKKADAVLLEKIERARSTAERAKKAFLEQTARAGVASEWQAVEGALFDAFTLHARFCDVAMVGQHYSESERVLGESAIDHLICSVGHAIMVVPQAGKFSTLGQRIMIAWDRSPVALRAVHNARPFLRAAKDVKILAVNIEQERHFGQPGSGIVQHLARHEIKAVPRHIDVNGMDVSRAILSCAAEENVDLLVMGAYGHSRLRERILGGATYDILRNTSVPVLMSH